MRVNKDYILQNHMLIKTHITLESSKTVDKIYLKEEQL